MKLFQRAVLAVLVFASMVLSMAFANASSYADEAAAGLQTSHLYVSPDINLTNDKRALLTSALRDDDNIYVALFPTYVAKTSNDAQNLVNEVESKLPQPAILVADVGGFVMAASSGGLPPDVLAARINSADSIATNTQEAIMVFVKDVHQYQDEHPAPKPPAMTVPDHSGLYWLGFAIGLFITLGLIYGGKAYLRSSARKLRSVPKSLREQLIRIQTVSNEIRDENIREVLNEIYENTHRMFIAIRKNQDASIKEIQAEQVLKQIANLAEKYRGVEFRGGGYAAAPRTLKSLNNQNDQLLHAIDRAYKGEMIDLEVAADMLDSTGI